MKDRLAEVRKILGFSQNAFAKELGVSQTSYWQYERGDRVFQPRYIETLRLKFNVNPDWLTKGEGTMFLESSGEDEFTKAFFSLSESNQELLMKLMKELLEKQNG